MLAGPQSVEQYCCLYDRALVELALRDVDRFQRQKVKDLKDVFTNYAVLQTEKCKKVCQTWISS